MKLYQHSIQFILITVLLTASATRLFAFDFYQDGIYYSFRGDNAVSVTYKLQDEYNSYSGNVVIPSTITYLGETYDVVAIEDYAFNKCMGLKSITIPNSIRSIGYEAFEGCAWLTSVKIPNSVSIIGYRAFANCGSLNTIKVESGNSTYDSRDNCNAIIKTADNRLITGCLGTIIPNTVTTIGECAFEGCVRLQNIAIPNSVTKIEHDAFYECFSLEQVSFGSSLQSIEYNAFRNCHNISNLSFPNSLTYLGNGAFMNCYELASVKLSNSLEHIDNCVFKECTKLNEVVIPASTSFIGVEAFAECPNIVSIRVEEGNSSYDSRDNCNAIIEKANNKLIAGCMNTVIPTSIKAIGSSAFYKCTGLTNVIIPATVSIIEDAAFYGCTGLTHIYTYISHFNDLTVGSSVFYNVPTETCMLHVPYGTLKVYQAMPQWREFQNMEEMRNTTDVNGDDEVSVADINYLIDLILSGTYDPKADANRDGELSIADVNKIVDHILSGGDDYMAQYAQSCLKNIYYLMHTAGWSTTGNTHQCFGISAYNLMAEVMGDDFIIGSIGSGWFWYDAAYDVKDLYTRTTWRSYDLWNAYYTLIGNANEILSMKDNMKPGASQARYVLGQAYAIRAYSYFMLAQSFARTFKGHVSDPCVPIYNGTSFSMSSSTGQPRSTVAQVYAQIDSDINTAISLLQGTTQQEPSHMGLPVVYGLMARVALVKEDWDRAQIAAEAAITQSGCQILDLPPFTGLNDASAHNVIWGAKIPQNQIGMYASLMAHMDANISYAQNAPKQISLWLYNKMNDSDVRKNGNLDDWGGYFYEYDRYGGWWDPNSYFSYGGKVQTKFFFSNLSTWEADNIWMRVEEMYLTAAEAACRLGREATAKAFLMNLMYKRDPNYTCNKTGTALATLTTEETGSLLEEILIQRRIELWGEDGRIYTIRRLKQGFERTTANGWPSGLCSSTHAYAWKDPESYAWVLTIPQTEFDNNPYMDVNTDQNPIGDYPE